MVSVSCAYWPRQRTRVTRPPPARRCSSGSLERCGPGLRAVRQSGTTVRCFSPAEPPTPDAAVCDWSGRAAPPRRVDPTGAEPCGRPRSCWSISPSARGRSSTRGKSFLCVPWPLPSWESPITQPAGGTPQIDEYSRCSAQLPRRRPTGSRMDGGAYEPPRGLWRMTNFDLPRPGVRRCPQMTSRRATVSQ